MRAINASKTYQAYPRATNERTYHVDCKDDKFNQEENKSAPCDVTQTDHYWKKNEAAPLSSGLMYVCSSRENLKQFGQDEKFCRIISPP